MRSTAFPVSLDTTCAIPDFLGDPDLLGGSAASANARTMSGTATGAPSPPDRALSAAASANTRWRRSSGFSKGLIAVTCLIRKSCGLGKATINRSEEHTSELKSLMRISYDVFCLKKKTRQIPLQ